MTLNNGNFIGQAKGKRRSPGTTASMVLAALKHGKRPYRAYELMHKLRHRGVTAPTTIYRALDQLIAGGRVHRLETLHAYIACTRGDCQHRSDAVFAICDDCGRVEELSDSTVASAAANWAKANTFKLSTTTFELRGICGACRASAGGGAVRS